MGEIGLRSFRELERKAGFAPGAIGKRKNALKLPTTEMALGMCQALRVPWDQLWSHANLSEPEETASAAELLFLLNQLPLKEQEELVEIAKAWIEARERARERSTRVGRQPESSEAAV